MRERRSGDDVVIPPDVADCYTVERKGDKFRVRHYPTRVIAGQAPCCEVVVQVTDADHAYDGGAEFGTLHRATVKIQRRHAARQQEVA